MRVLIIEDEIPASTGLVDVLKEIDPQITIQGILQNMQDVKQRIGSFTGKVDLIFMEVLLQGENVLAALPQLPTPAPIIFVTAHNGYMSDALQHLSLDYILKPISCEKLQKSLSKYAVIKNHFLHESNIPKPLLLHHQRKVRSRILLRKGADFHFCCIEDVAYFYSEFKLIFLVDVLGQKHLTDIKTLSIIEQELDPSIFYRANRKFIININAIKKFKVLDRVKLSVELKVRSLEEIVISQENASDFKNWITSKDEIDV